MELVQVRYFLALAKALHFTRAAEACNISQPALTRAIRRLEEEVGGPLLHRRRNLTQLTQLGAAILPHFEAVYAAANAASAQAAAFSSREATPLRLGLDDTLSAAFLAPVLCELRNRLMGLDLSLIEGNSSKLFALLLDGALNSAVVVEPERIPERLNRWQLFRESYVIICAESHPFGQRKTVTAADFGSECVLIRAPSGSDFEKALDRLWHDVDAKPTARHTAWSENHTHVMVAAGFGVAISAALQPVAPGVVARPFAGPSAMRQITLVAVAGHQYGSAPAAFLKLMRARDWSGLAAGEISRADDNSVSER